VRLGKRRKAGASNLSCQRIKNTPDLEPVRWRKYSIFYDMFFTAKVMRFSQGWDTKQKAGRLKICVMVIRPLRDCLCHGHWARSAQAKNALQIGAGLTEEKQKIILLVRSVCRICNSILQNSFGTDQAPTLRILRSYIQTGTTSYTIGYGLKDRGSIPNRNFFIFPSRSDRLLDPSNLSYQKVYKGFFS